MKKEGGGGEGRERENIANNLNSTQIKYFRHYRRYSKSGM